MKLKLHYFVAICLLPLISFAQGDENRAFYHGTISSIEYVSPISQRSQDLLPAIEKKGVIEDGRSRGGEIREQGDPQTENDFFTINRSPEERSSQRTPAEIVFDAYSSTSQPTDPSLAVGPNHILTVFNTGFAVYDKAGIQLLGPTAPNPAIFPTGGCCDLTVSYDNAADRWVLTFLGAGAQIAVSDGPNPLTSGWFVYSINSINDYQKLSIWSDGYYITDNTTGANKVYALERDAMLVGDPSAQVVGFNLPGLSTSGFFSPQVLNVTDSNLPASGGATVVYFQDNAWAGVTQDHVKVWTIDVNWTNPGTSTISNPNEIITTPFISVFDNGSFSNLAQPGGGNIDALQATVMNQAQFRKFGTHNSAVFNFVVDTDASAGELAGVRWMEFRQSGDNLPWSLFQEGTYTAADGKHAWNASLAMDGQGNIGMGYSSMSGPSTPSTVRVSSYFTSRLSTDPLGVMTGVEEVIQNGNQNIPGFRYGDYSKIDVDPSDDQSFWYITEYNRSGRKGVVGKFHVEEGIDDTEAPTDPTNLVVSGITSNSASLAWTASTDNVGVSFYNIFLDGVLEGTSPTNSFGLSGLSPLIQYDVAVSAVDGAGNESGQVSNTFTTLDSTGQPGVIAGYFFETGLDGWSDPGSDCRRFSNTTAAFEGQWGIFLRDNSSTSNSVSPIVDLTGNTEVTIEFHVFTNGMEPGENFFVEFFNGSTFQIIGDYVRGIDYGNNEFVNGSITLNSASFDFNSNNRFRFRCDASDNSDRILFDAVVISGDNVPTIQSPEVVRIDNAAASRSFTQEAEETINMYPNPVSKQLTIEMQENAYDEITIISAMGRVLQTSKPEGSLITVDVSNLSSGMYFVHFVSGKRAVTKRFIKK